MRIQAIASGSNGNAVFVGEKNTAVLVDAGISCKRITEGLKKLSVRPEDLTGVLVTHDHSDHTAGLKILLKHYRIPLYGTEETIGRLSQGELKDDIYRDLFRVIASDRSFMLGDLRILPVPTFHDAPGSVGYRFDAQNASFAVLTDTGTFTDEMTERLQDLSGILLEANHDVRMLEVGSYPYVLKRRILGDFGHLSNERSGELLSRILSPRMKIVLLGHLSEENNYPDLARMSVMNEIDASDTPWKSSDFDIRVALRTESSDIFEL